MDRDGGAARRGGRAVTAPHFVNPAKAGTQMFSHEGMKSTKATKGAKPFAIFVSFVPSCEPMFGRYAAGEAA